MGLAPVAAGRGGGGGGGPKKRGAGTAAAPGLLLWLAAGGSVKDCRSLEPPGASEKPVPVGDERCK